LNARADFVQRFPFSLKSGLQVQQQTRDIVKPGPGAYNFVGPDRIANTADDNASLYDIFDTQYSNDRSFLFGTPAIPVPDPYRLWRLFAAHPEYFSIANPATIVSNTANNSQWFRETISAAYLMGDAKLIQN